MKSLAALAFVAGVALSHPAAAYCIGWDKELPGYREDYYSVAQEFERAKYVAVIRVTAETWLGEDGKPKALQPPFQFDGPRPWGFDPYLGAYYDVVVLTPYKGDPPRRLRLFSENTTARFWLTIGGSYLAFMHEWDQDIDGIGRPLTLDNCGNSLPLNRAGRIRREVSLLSRR